MDSLNEKRRMLGLRAKSWVLRFRTLLQNRRASLSLGLREHSKKMGILKDVGTLPGLSEQAQELPRVVETISPYFRGGGGPIMPLLLNDGALSLADRCRSPFFLQKKQPSDCSLTAVAMRTNKFS